MMLLSDIKSLLSGVDTNIYLSEMPDTPDNVTVLYFSGGQSPQHAFDGKVYEQPSFQVRIRDKSAAAAIAKAEAVKAALDGLHDLVIGSARYLSISQRGDIMQLGKDDKGRSEYTVNFDVKRSV